MQGEAVDILLGTNPPERVDGQCYLYSRTTTSESLMAFEYRCLLETWLTGLLFYVRWYDRHIYAHFTGRCVPETQHFCLR